MRLGRAALAAFVLVILTAPLTVDAQQVSKVHRIGLLLTGNPPDPNVEAFQEALRELGYVDGQNLVIDYRWANGRADRWPEFAAALVAALGARVTAFFSECRRVCRRDGFVLISRGSGLTSIHSQTGGTAAGYHLPRPAVGLRDLSPRGGSA